MDPKPTEKPDPQTEIIPDLPVSPDEADDVSGGRGEAHPKRGAVAIEDRVQVTVSNAKITSWKV